MYFANMRAALLFGTAFAALPTTALADEAQPERDYLPGDIVVTGKSDGYGNDDGFTAVKTPTPLIDVPQAVTAITRDQIDDQNATSLNEALRFVPGVSLETGEGHRDEVFIRGQETTADFFLDGLRDDAQYYRPLYNVERVEVLKGANALIFGRGAGGGAINRVSKKARLGETLTAGAASVDNWGAFTLATDLAAPVGNSVALRLNATYEEFDNHRDVFEGRFIGISPTATVALGEVTDLVLSYTYDDDQRVVDRGVPAFLGRPLTGYDETFFGDQDYNYSDVEAHIARARLDHDFGGGLTANAALQYAHYDKFYSNIVPSGASDADGDGVADTASLSGYEAGTIRENLIGQANLVWTGDTGGIGHTLLIGTEFSRQDTDADRDRTLFDGERSYTTDLAETIFVPPFTFEFQRASTSELSTLSFYIQDQIDVADWLQLIIGARYDEFDLESYDIGNDFLGTRKDDRISPRLGVIVKPQDNLSLYASYSESFLPASGDQFTVLSSTSINLEPETFETLEAGIKYAPREDLLVTAAMFRLDRKDTPFTEPVSNVVLQTGATRVQGFEASLAGSITEQLHVNLGYTYLDGEIRSQTNDGGIGTELQQLPEHQIGAWGRYDFTDNLGAGLGLVHQSSQFASFSNDVVLPAYTRVDAALFYTVNDRMSVQLNIENLLDEDYYPSAHGDNNIQPGKPLTAKLGVRFEL
ncbi:TonB-dependent siderophore receptor [Qipengyuania sp. XHP0207]|uniref:TonB-dependent receptor n=1 Tax=Qipengyuania sp. XHP0207 TaxID=3038078 RepID=UPI0024204563|nr:TonB-dependent siderophore receptor [Qipengyuania sp. XHP0207]MDG5749222.1 TonB-dependent siderophore receptor [Qipengyuania sp. XHP0207]